VRTLYRAGRVHTLDLPQPGEWLLSDDRHVQRVGTGEPPAADRVVDLPGATIIPGLIDAHVHLTSTGLFLEQAETAAAPSCEALLALASSRDDPDEAVVALQGFDETRWADPRFPTAAQLATATRRPLVIGRVDGHLSLANPAAIEASQIGGMEGCLRDEDGLPTGVVIGDANRRLSHWVATARPPHRTEELQLAAAAAFAAGGVTTVHEMAMPREQGANDLEVFLGHRDRLPVDALAIVATMDVPFAVELGLRAIGGDLAVDGSVGARTAAVREPYTDVGGFGVLSFDDDELAGFFRDAHDAGLQVGMHAIGDRAIEQVLASWERIYATLDSRERRHFRARRHRVEHFELPSDEQVERAAMLGLAVSVQPTFDALWGFPGGLYATALGPDRAAAMNPIRTMLDRGLVVGAGSDAPVTPPEGWRGVSAMERHHDPRERLTRAEAIRVHTAGSARLAHQEEKKGTLAPGHHADFAAYDRDPFEVDDVVDLRSILTVSLGREVSAR
jgi:predicted amidohydrolase YtcJ